MPTEQEAYNIIRDEWPNVHHRPATNNEILFTQAVGRLESNYGRAPDQHAQWASEGKYNWANIEMRAKPGEDPPEGWVAGKDSAQNVWFQVFPNDNLAARALIHALTVAWNRPVIQAMQDPATPEAVAHAMKIPPEKAYYSAPESQYATALRNALTAIQKGTGKSVDPPGQQTQVASGGTSQVTSTSSIAPKVAVVGGIGAAIYAIWRIFFK